jgi:hypothetical protein
MWIQIMQLTWIGCQVIEFVLIGAPDRVVKVVAMSRVDDTQRFIRVVLAEADDLAVVEGEAVFPFREAEAPELNVDVLASLPGLFHCEEVGLGHWDGAAVKVGARV